MVFVAVYSCLSPSKCARNMQSTMWTWLSVRAIECWYAELPADAAIASTSNSLVFAQDFWPKRDTRIFEDMEVLDEVCGPNVRHEGRATAGEAGCCTSPRWK